MSFRDIEYGISLVLKFISKSFLLNEFKRFLNDNRGGLVLSFDEIHIPIRAGWTINDWKLMNLSNPSVAMIYLMIFVRKLVNWLTNFIRKRLMRILNGCCTLITQMVK